MSREQELGERLRLIQHCIAEAEKAAGRVPGSVRLLPVTKYHPASDLSILQSLGVREVAENREQEARDKAAQLPDLDFHMIGQIQTKKANSVARWASCVHSIDSLRLIDALERGTALAIERGDRTEKALPCLIQLSLDGDATRGGVTADGVEKLADALEAAAHLELAGLMCVPPRDWEPKAAFAQAAQVHNLLQDQYGRAMELSAGMSGDMGEAIVYGSTIVRVGTAIMGARPLP